MSDQSSPASVTAMPRVWKTILLASLALNLLIGGAIATRFFMHGPQERLVGASYAQLVPRRFLMDLTKERRGELLGVLRVYRPDFREGHKAARLASGRLADALQQEPYDPAAAAAVIDAYATNGISLVQRGAAAAKDFISKLSPEERRLMAERLRQRAGLNDDDDGGSGQGPGGG